jgi:hypothetical protein
VKRIVSSFIPDPRPLTPDPSSSPPTPDPPN